MKKFAVRKMVLDDLEQVLAIEKDAFPDLFPPTSFRSELKRSRSEYFVAYAIKDIEKLEDLETNFSANVEKHLQYRSGYTGWQRGCKFLVGFVGYWKMVDEVHIISIAVRRNVRRQGIGELLLRKVLHESRNYKFDEVTLEVRKSNTAAKKLYNKYGFQSVGVRKRYYTDNFEDALVMTLSSVKDYKVPI